MHKYKCKFASLCFVDQDLSLYTRKNKHALFELVFVSLLQFIYCIYLNLQVFSTRVITHL